MKPFGIKGLVTVCLLWLIGTAAPALAGKQLVIVKSSDNTYFNQSIETLVSRVEGADGHRILTADELAGRVDPNDDNLLLVALGEKAVQAVDRLGSTALSVNAYITLEQYRKLGIEGQPSILLDQPLHRYLAFTRQLLEIASLGVIDEHALVLGPRAERIMAEVQLEISQYQVDEDNKLLPVLRQLLQNEDALLMLPRSAIYNRDSLKGVLLTSYRNRKPVISYSPAHVKAGALASIYSSPRDIGHHLARLINRLLASPGDEAPAYEFARFYSITTNPRVARALDLDLPSEAEMRAKIDELER